MAASHRCHRRLVTRLSRKLPSGTFAGPENDVCLLLENDVAVLVEGLSVIVRRNAVDDHMVGGWHGFLEIVPNSTLCTDEELARVGFLAPEHVGEFIDLLENRGLVFLRGKQAVDVSVVDQQNGPTAETPWLQYAHMKLSGGERRVATCWLFDGPKKGHGLHMKTMQTPLATPDGWVYEGSLSSNFEFRPTRGEGAH
jgi:hypothetical protein